MTRPRTLLFRRFVAFTLIELLIVVAIIAILALIALPNFHEAQVRAKTTRVKADMRTLATALEAYVVDQGQYPQCDNNGWPRWMVQLSTPVAYVNTAHHADPFLNLRGPATQRVHPYFYYGFNEVQCLNTYQPGQLFLPSVQRAGSRRIQWWMLMSVGPNQLRDNNGRGTVVQYENLVDPACFSNFCYDPSNGTVSIGDILRPGGGIGGHSAAGLKGSGMSW